MNNILDVLGQEMAVQVPKADSTSDLASLPTFRFSEKHKLLKLRLAPLRGIQADLERKLGSGAFEDQGQSNASSRTRSQSTSALTPSVEPPQVDGDEPQIRRLPKEFYIRSNNSWKDRFRNGLRNAGRPLSGRSLQTGFGAWGIVEKEISADELRKSNAELEEIAGVIAGCKEDIKTLWEDEVVQSVLSKRKYRVDESSGLCVFRSLNCFTAED